jgi:hypothetical protein
MYALYLSLQPVLIYTQKKPAFAFSIPGRAAETTVSIDKTHV